MGWLARIIASGARLVPSTAGPRVAAEPSHRGRAGQTELCLAFRRHRAGPPARDPLELRAMEPEELTPTFFADVEEMGCGSLMVALMRAMRGIGRGEVLQIRAADPGARHDIPSWCRMTGHRLLHGPCGATGDEYLIRKRED